MRPASSSSPRDIRNVSIRKIAERIEYSPAAIYGYFPSKDDIFFALAEEGLPAPWGPGGEREAAAELANREPLERMQHHLLRVFTSSAAQHPQYFALMFVDRSVPRIGHEYERFAFAREMKQHLVEDIQTCIDAGVLPRTVKPFVAIRLLTMSIVGVGDAAPVRSARARGRRRTAWPRDVINVMFAGLQSGIALESTRVTSIVRPTNEGADLQAS